MKKLLLIALIGFSLTSCKKDYVCECRFVNQVGNDAAERSEIILIDKSDRVDARIECNEKHAYFTYTLDNTIVSCELK